MITTPDILRFSVFGEGVVQGISTRHGGVSAAPYDSLNLGVHVDDDPAAVTENRMRFLRTVGVDAVRTVAVNQVHGDTIIGVREEHAGMGAFNADTLEADAMMTRTPNLPLLVQSADCALILLHDPAHAAVAAVHAGWRGSVGGTLIIAVMAMNQEFGTSPTDLRAGIAPTIGPCCYEVDKVVLDPLDEAFPYWFDQVVTPGRPDHGNLNLQELNRLQLVAMGVPPKQIEVMAVCTSCNKDRFYSERGSGRPTGRFGAVIALR